MNEIKCIRCESPAFRWSDGVASAYCGIRDCKTSPNPNIDLEAQEKDFCCEEFKELSEDGRVDTFRCAACGLEVEACCKHHAAEVHSDWAETEHEFEMS